MANTPVKLPKPAEQALEEFKEASSKILKEKLEPENSFEYPQTMFHYTNDVGLCGILSSGNIWLTDMFSLNDTSELYYGLSAGADILKEKFKNEGGEFGQNYAEALGSDLKSKFKDFGQFFCCSFSWTEDDLGQWRAYADDGSGFALGFDCAKLHPKFIGGNSSAAFPIQYDERLLKETHEEIIDKIIPLVPHLESQLSEFLRSFQIPNRQKFNEYVGQLQMCLAEKLLRVALHFKHSAYEMEREYRFLTTKNKKDTTEVRLRPRNYRWIKYIEFDWRSAGADVLKKIVIGPAADFEKSKKFAEECLRRAGFDPASIEITQSKIPYQPA